MTGKLKLDGYSHIEYNEELLCHAWLVWVYKNHNPFAALDFIIGGNNETFRISLEDYYQDGLLYVTKKYTSREQALRSLGRILDKYQPKKPLD